MSRFLHAILSQKKWRSVPASHRFKALFRWLPSHNRNRKNCSPL